MDIELMYFDGCPNWELARGRLADALLAAGGPAPEIRLRRVASVEDARECRFPGSPTILIDGRDPFADPLAPVAFACRIYSTEQGLQGAPSVSQLLRALHT